MNMNNLHDFGGGLVVLPVVLYFLVQLLVSKGQTFEPRTPRIAKIQVVAAGQDTTKRTFIPSSSIPSHWVNTMHLL